MDPIWWALIGLILGVLAGAGIAWALSGRIGPGKTVEVLKKENEQFREEVTEHFVQTAELINKLTDSYKAVFDHLSTGAEELVDKKALAERMPKVSGREVTLKHIGAPQRGDGGGTPGSATRPGQGTAAESRNPVKKGAVRSTLTAKRPK